VRGHFGRSHMDWRSGREQRTVRLFFKVAVSALDVGLGEGVVGDAIDANCFGGCSHAAIGNARTSGEQQDAVGRGVKRIVRPSLRAFVGGWLSV